MPRPVGCRPRVSVVMTVFEPEPRFFNEAVESVLRQTLADIELVIIEDPPAGRPCDVLSRFSDPRIRYFRGSHRTSLIEQRNRALAEARADLVAVLDCDDIAEPDRLERQTRYMDAHPDIAVLGSHVAVIDGGGRIIGHRVFPREHDAIARAMRRIVPLCHPSVVYRKELVERAGGYSGRLAPLAEDYELYSRLFLLGARFANYPRALTRYRVHVAQAKARRLRETIRAVLKVKNRYWRTSMSLGDRLRMWAERCLLCAPEAVVWRLLTSCHYHDKPPESPGDLSSELDPLHDVRREPASAPLLGTAPYARVGDVAKSLRVCE
ncbi:MAG TPA: glycosyltransferase [Pirellulales bacterium]